MDSNQENPTENAPNTTTEPLKAHSEPPANSSDKASPQVKAEPIQLDVKKGTSESKSTEQTPSLKNETTLSIPDPVSMSDSIGGAPVRKWLNKEVSPYLLQGMRELVKVQPEDPLTYLGEYLIHAAKERSNDK